MLDIDRNLRVPLKPLLELLVPSEFPGKQPVCYRYLEILRRNLQRGFPEANTISVVDLIQTMYVNIIAASFHDGQRIVIKEMLPMVQEKVAVLHPQFAEQVRKWNAQFEGPLPRRERRRKWSRK